MVIKMQISLTGNVIQETMKPKHDTLQLYVKELLIKKGYKVKSEVLIQKGFIDLVATKDDTQLLIEVKPELIGIGDTLRQINRYKSEFYSHYSKIPTMPKNKFCLAIPAENISEQTINFFVEEDVPVMVIKENNLFINYLEHSLVNS